MSTGARTWRSVYVARKDARDGGWSAPAWFHYARRRFNSLARRVRRWYISFPTSTKEMHMSNGLDSRTLGTDVADSGAQTFAPAAQPLSLPDLERELATVRLPLEEATTLPGRLYHDPAIHQRELRDIFSKMWLCVGREEDIEKPGDFLTRTVGRESVIVVRDAASRINAFHNVCRHRGSRLVTEPSGSGLKNFLCPYHAWTYGLDGGLRVAPNMEEARNFERTQYGLNRVRLERWDGFLFINFSSGGPGLMAHLGEMATKCSRFRMGGLRRGKRISYSVDRK